MPRKIIGNTTATPNPQPDWNQTDSTKADYIANKPDVDALSTKVVELEALVKELSAKVQELTRSGS